MKTRYVARKKPATLHGFLFATTPDINFIPFTVVLDSLTWVTITVCLSLVGSIWPTEILYLSHNCRYTPTRHTWYKVLTECLFMQRHLICCVPLSEGLKFTQKLFIHTPVCIGSVLAWSVFKLYFIQALKPFLTQQTHNTVNQILQCLIQANYIRNILMTLP